MAVHEELTDARTPEIVRRCIMSTPAWFEVGAVRETKTTTFPVALQRGEREAILLAEALPADVLLIDEQIGRTIAVGRNLPLSGTLGVLERADTMGFLSDFPQVVQRLKVSGFFVTDALEQRLLGTSSHAAKNPLTWKREGLSPLRARGVSFLYLVATHSVYFT